MELFDELLNTKYNIKTMFKKFILYNYNKINTTLNGRKDGESDQNIIDRILQICCVVYDCILIHRKMQKECLFE